MPSGRGVKNVGLGPSVDCASLGAADVLAVACVGAADAVLEVVGVLHPTENAASSVAHKQYKYEVFMPAV